MKEAFDKLEAEEGMEKAELFNTNAKNIINGDAVSEMDYQKLSSITKKKRFWFF